MTLLEKLYPLKETNSTEMNSTIAFEACNYYKHVFRPGNQPTHGISIARLGVPATSVNGSVTIKIIT